MASTNTIYLDYAATTPVAAQVLDSMMPYLTDRFGNPSSFNHQIGLQAKEGIDQARAEVALCLAVSPEEVIFTSGGTESNNLALKGAMQQFRGGHFAISAVEHSSIIDSAKSLENDGFRMTVIPPTSEGEVTIDAVKEAIQPDTKLISVMWGNNEVGTINQIETIANHCRSKGILIHSDASQALGHVEVDASLVDLLTITGHKVYAPKGIGALIVGKPVSINPQIVGGQSHRGLRAGTINVPSVVGFGKACSICNINRSASIAGTRDLCESILREEFSNLVINGKLSSRLPHISNVQFPQVGPDFSPAMLSGVACSSGSACQSGLRDGSHVLKAMGKTDLEALSTLRLSFGRNTSNEDAKNAANAIISSIKKVINYV